MTMSDSIDAPADGSALRFQRPALPSGAAIERYFALSREERWFSNGGPCWRLLRDRLSERVGAYCVPVASGTVGLMASIAAVLGETDRHRGGHEALVPSFTFPASAQSTFWAGLQPRLLDVDAAHWHLDAAQLEHELGCGDRTALVVAVSSFGTPPPPEARERWERACRTSGVPLVVDSAAGFGAIADDMTPIGAQGDVEVVSFHATKPFAIGEGGAVFTRDARLRERVEQAINFGFDADHRVRTLNGLNGKMSELHAATALAVLDDFADGVLAPRRRAAASLRREAGPHLTWQDGCEHSTWQFVPVAFDDATARAAAVDRCASAIETRTYYEPLHLMDALRNWPIAEGGLQRTEDLVGRLLCLPMANDLADREIAQIAAVIRSAAVGPHRVAQRAL
ncbi:MAG: hypothetical protein JWQ48_506 [Conexibacter sp.]|nr:hypothetical protein [Conexibacter sp.]